MKTSCCLNFNLWIIVLLLTAHASQAMAAFPDYHFKQLSLQQGLSQATVSCVLKDYKGIIWIGTRMGLNKFDQYELKSYLCDPFNSNSLPDNNIFILQEDSLLNLWVGTQEGLALYNRGEDNFTLQYDGKYPIQAHSACLVSDGIIFAGVDLYKYSYKDKQIHKLPYFKKGKAIYDYFSYIKPWKDNIYIVGTQWKGVYLYDIMSQELTPFKGCPEKHITSYYLDEQKNLWLSPYGKGILCYEINGEEIARFSTLNSDLCNDVVLDMLTYRDELWIATDGGGISRLQLSTSKFQTIENQTGNVNSFPVNSVMSLYVDKSDNLWAGTIRGGLLNIREVYMRTFQDVPLNNSYGLSNKTALCLYEDKEAIYVGTDGGGINKFDPKNSSFKHYPTTYKGKVVSIAGYSNQELLISFFDKGLYFFDKQSGKCRPCYFLDETIQSKTKALGLCIFIKQIQPDKYLFMADQVYIYDQITHKLSPTQIVGIRKDTDTPIGSLNVIYVSDSLTYLNGIKNIFQLDNHTQILSPIYYAPSNVTINDVCRDDKGNFWMATSRGLIKYTSENGNVEKVETILFNEAQIASFDPAGRLWIGAKGMLFAYSISDGRFTIFGESDGVLTNEYIATGNFISRSGDIYLGGVTGLLSISKNFPITNSNDPPIELMDIQLNGVTITNQLSEEGELTLPVQYTSLVIKVVGNENDVFRRKIYRFHISGLSKDIETYAPSLALYSLPSGTYEVDVSCSNRDGSWTIPVKILTFIIPTPWWKSSYFIVGLCLFMSALCIGFVIYYNRKKERKLQWEIKEQQEKMNEEKVRFLINMSHELCTPLMLVYAPLRRMLNSNMIDHHFEQQLKSVCKHVKRMKNLIEMVLDVRRMEMGQNVLHPSHYPFNEWLRNVADSFSTEYDNKQIRLVYDFDSSISEWKFDANKCEIIISNLLMNALKFSPEKSKVTIVTRKSEEGFISISVTDEGIGLDQKDQEKLFVRFYQGYHSKEGSGIGLSYVKALVELQGGRIRAFNNPDSIGTTFCFELPDIQTDKASTLPIHISLNDVLRYTDQKEQLSLVQGEPFETNSYSILIAEDNIELCDLLKDTLQEHFQNVYTTNNGKDAFKIANQRLPDIIVSDIIMEHGNGYELCQQLKTQEGTSFIPVVLLTARTDPDSATASYNSGADVYLTKPFDIEDLILILRNQLRIRKQLQMYYRNNGGTAPKPELSPRDTLSNADEAFIMRLNTIIIENMSNNQLDAELLSEKIGMSRTSLYNRLKTALPIGLSDYINNFRIEKALQMLRETDLSILEISEIVGFANQRYFSTFFKKMVGCTPSGYREENTKRT